MRYTTIEKEVGETPLEALARIRERDDIPLSIPLAYAGRLDPMASGKLLVLIGEECKRQSDYHGLDKAYDFEILLGFESDTGDLLGLADRTTPPHAHAAQIVGSATQTLSDTRSYSSLLQKTRIAYAVQTARIAEKLQGSLTLPYPLFSSKTVCGKPLFLWTLENRLSEIKIPTATTQLYSLMYQRHSTISAHDLLATIESRIQKITPVTEASKALGEGFRRVPILKQWHKLLEDDTRTYEILRMRAVVSSGTYIRALAPRIASLLGTQGLCYSIHRTHIGRYRKIPFLKKGFWFPSY